MDIILRNNKKIHDNIHGYITLTVMATEIIDHPYFQRLRKLKQLGVCNYIFPNAIHTRFEHSIGTYYLTNKILFNIKKNSDNITTHIPELENYFMRTYGNTNFVLDTYVCELIKIAALCHDIGHGAFSHVFDDIFLPQIYSDNVNLNLKHEYRSGLILEHIINNNHILNKLIHTDEIQFMKLIIDPKQQKSFVYQIVSNSLNSIDVDKMDYLMRDIFMIYGIKNIQYSRLIEDVIIINDELTYPDQSTYDILTLFRTRHDMHRQIYCHKGVISVQYLIIELFFELNDVLNIANSINNMEHFCDITDEYIIESAKLLKIDKAIKIVKRLEHHDLYPFIDCIITKTKLNIDEFKEKYNNDILIFQTKIGFVSGEKNNPLDEIKVYNTKDNSKSHKLTAIKKNKNNITILLPSLYQENITMVFCKNKELVNNIKEKLVEWMDNIP